MKQKGKIAAALFIAFVSVFFIIQNARAQTPTPTPKPSPAPSPATEAQPFLIGGYEVTSSVEVGGRWLDVNGSSNKFRSDFNYKSGFRIFDSSLLIEDKQKRGKFFDSLLINSSGWGADPMGFFHLRMEKTGLYRFDSKGRRVIYFNSLNNHALNEHNANTRHNFGDFDLTVFPEREDLRLRFGYSFNKTDGTGGFTTRPYSDEFPVTSNVNLGSFDLRAGIDGKLLGFNLSLSGGYRRFSNDTSYTLLAPHPGNNPANNARLATFQRNYPIVGDTFYTTFSVHRTFAKKVDFTGRFIYSDTDTTFRLFETITGRDNSNNIVDLDRFDVSGDSRRPQGRGDIGLTFRVTDNFRISNTFTYDQFNISGGNQFFEALMRRNAAGTVILPTVFTSTLAHRVTAYRRATNMIEADYQVNNFFGFNIGYRFTDRRVVLQGFDLNLLSAAPAALLDEEFTNRTNAVIAGMKLKPAKNWTIFADVEHGDADNVFTRLSNYKFTNFRVRSRLNLKQVSLNLSAITKDNDNPSQSSVTPQVDFTANVKTRIFSGSLDWTPVDKFSLSTGYTYQDLTSKTDIRVPVGGVITQGISQFFMRDNYAFFDITAQPVKRISLFASYRISQDNGQGNRVSLLPQNIITSYPFRLHSPEARLVFRINKNIDWNLGYQYYDYSEKLGINQNYSAHLPYTSLRIYFGRKE